MARGETHEVRGLIQRETDAAILLELEDGEDVWFPLSQVDEIHHRGHYDELDRLVVSKWIARQKGLC